MHTTTKGTNYSAICEALKVALFLSMSGGNGMRAISELRYKTCIPHVNNVF